MVLSGALAGYFWVRNLTVSRGRLEKVSEDKP